MASKPTDHFGPTIEGLLAQHPWPQAYAAERRLEWLWHFDLPVGSAELWPVIADTSRMNRALGVSEMKFIERDGQRWGSSKAGGVRHEWIEVPWNWVAGRWIESLRIYQHGFARVVYGVFHLEPRPDGGTRLYIYFGVVPRGLFGSLLLSVGFAGLRDTYAALLPKIADDLVHKRPLTLLLTPGELAPGAEARLAAIGEELQARGLSAVCIARLIDWIRRGDDQDLYRIQVRERARAWSVDEDALLRVCLHATRMGMLMLSWDLMCPHCRGVTGENAKLKELAAQARCEVCMIDFGSDTADSVEITFHVHPSIREVPQRTFCSAEPATKEHIRVQRMVPAGGEVLMEPGLAPGRYRLRLGGEKRYGYLDVCAGSDSIVTWKAGAGPILSRRASATQLLLRNDTPHEQIFIVETLQWSDSALRPGRLLSLQEFRDLFSAEHLAADVQLAVGQQTILFTDIVGSTALYEQCGDAAAFLAVRRHFAEVLAIVARHRGAVVKTIGDAVMGAFKNPLDAVQAALEIHTSRRTAAQPAPGSGPATEQPPSALMPQLRLSLHTGPCIAVKLNSDMDYFGQTVNIAAKLQALVSAWQVVLSDVVLRAPGVADWLAEQGIVPTELRFELRSLAEPIVVHRFDVKPS